MPFWGDQLVTLDRGDTLHSAQAKLDSAGGGQRIVVLASDCRIFGNVLTYKLLARASERFASPIAVVAGNPQWRQVAREQGLGAYASLGSLRRARERSILSLLESLADSLVCRLHLSLAGFVVLMQVLLTAGVAVYFLVPVMSVTIRTTAEVLDREISARVAVGSEAVDLHSATIPGRIVERRFSVSDFVETTGDKRVGKERAWGEVTLLNSGPGPITLPAGTVLTAGTGERFTTAEAAMVGPFALPADAITALSPRPGDPDPGQSAEQAAAPEAIVRVPVVAAEPGEMGNVPALAISRIEGDAFRGMNVFNERPLAGGTDARARTVSAEDPGRSKETLLQRLQAQALEELGPGVRPSESLIPHSLQVRVDSVKYDEAVDEEADRLKGTLYGSATGIVFANQDLNSLVKQEWSRRSTSDGYRALAGDLELSPPEVLEAGPRAARLRVQVSGRAERVQEPDELPQGLRGTPVEEAKARLARLEGPLKLESLQMWPEWAPIAHRVEVQLVR